MRPWVSSQRMHKLSVTSTLHIGSISLSLWTISPWGQGSISSRPWFRMYQPAFPPFYPSCVFRFQWVRHSRRGLWNSGVLSYLSYVSVVGINTMAKRNLGEWHTDIQVVRGDTWACACVCWRGGRDCCERYMKIRLTQNGHSRKYPYMSGCIEADWCQWTVSNDALSELSELNFNL